MNSIFNSYSVTKIKSLQNCPLQYYLKYVLKLKMEPVEDRDTLACDVGSAAHRILELTLKGEKLEQAYKIAKVEFEGKIVPDKWEEEVNTLEYHITQFQERIEDFKDKNPIKRVLPEFKVAITEDWKPCDFFDKNVYLRGVIDLGLVLENNDVIIIDHKTGGNPAFGIKNYKFQLNSYKALYHYGISRIEGAQAGIHFIREGEVKLDDYSPREEIEGNIRNDIDRTIESAIDTVVDMGYFKHRRCSACNYCDYDPICKKKQYKQYEDESGKIIHRLKHVQDDQD